MSTSPFEIHRSKVLGHYSTAAWLRAVVMALFSGSSHKVGLSNLASIDAEHFKAFNDMVTGYRQNGENDPAFMALAKDVIRRQESWFEGQFDIGMAAADAVEAFIKR